MTIERKSGSEGAMNEFEARVRKVFPDAMPIWRSLDGQGKCVISRRPDKDDANYYHELGEYQVTEGLAWQSACSHPSVVEAEAKEAMKFDEEWLRKAAKAEEECGGMVGAGNTPYNMAVSAIANAAQVVPAPSQEDAKAPKDRVWIASYTASEKANVLSRGLYFRSIHDSESDALRMAPQAYPALDFKVTEYARVPFPDADGVKESQHGWSLKSALEYYVHQANNAPVNYMGNHTSRSVRVTDSVLEQHNELLRSPAPPVAAVEEAQPVADITYGVGVMKVCPQPVAAVEEAANFAVYGANSNTFIGNIRTDVTFSEDASYFVTFRPIDAAKGESK